MTAHPAAYLRRSYVDPDSPGDISREAQRAAVRRLAAADGHNGDLIQYDDWGLSADVAKSAKRTAYTRLLADMEAGKVTAVYAFDVDRLYRDPRDLIRLQDAAQRHNVKIVTTGGPLAIGDGDDPDAEWFAFLQSTLGRREIQKAKKRARAAREARRDRGDVFGHPPFGFRHVKDASGRIVREVDPSQPVAPILAAYKEAGTVLGAVRLLNERQIASPKGGRWYTSPLTRVLEAHAPELLPRRGPSGARIRPRHPSILSQLVKCHCGTVMTPNTHRRQLYCNRGPGMPDHGRYTVQEKDVLPWVRAEAERLQVPHAGATVGGGDHGNDRQAIMGRLARYAELYAEGGANGIDRERYEAEKARAARELDELEQSEALLSTVPDAIAWDRPPETINGALRAMWRHVQLDADMKPVAAEWIRPEWQRP